MLNRVGIRMAVIIDLALMFGSFYGVARIFDAPVGVAMLLALTAAWLRPSVDVIAVIANGSFSLIAYSQRLVQNNFRIFSLLTGSRSIWVRAWKMVDWMGVQRSPPWQNRLGWTRPFGKQIILELIDARWPSSDSCVVEKESRRSKSCRLPNCFTDRCDSFLGGNVLVGNA